MNTKKVPPEDNQPTATAPSLLELNSSQLPRSISPYLTNPTAGFGSHFHQNIYPAYPISTPQSTSYASNYSISPENPNSNFNPNDLPPTYASLYSSSNSSRETPAPIQYNYQFNGNIQSTNPNDNEHWNPTVKPTENFNPFSDALILCDTLKTSEPNKDLVINILCKRSYHQRVIIAQEYQKTNRDLIKALKVKLNGNFRDLIVSLMTHMDVLAVKDLYMSIDRRDFNMAPEIICTLSNEELKYLKSMFENMYGKSLKSFINEKALLNCKMLLLEICQCMRDESNVINEAQAEMDAKNLKSSTSDDDSYFIDIFTKRSFLHIKLICQLYEQLFKKSLEKKIKNIFTFFDQQGYLVIARFSCNKQNYYAKRLHQSMKGLGTNDAQLIRIIATRAEIDLKDIKDAFNRIIKENLIDWIEDNCSGHYKKGLLTLLGEN